MGTLVIFNFIQIAVIALVLYVVKKFARTERAARIVLLIAPLVTIVFHYSSFLFRLITGNDAVEYLGNNPNLIMPIYPCNLVMWCALIYGLMKDKTSRLALLISDYMFWFGIFSTLVGMFANVDFIVNPTLADYEVTKSIVAHATLLFNVLLVPVLGYLRPDFFRNMRNLAISFVVMYVVGSYCNLVFRALVSDAAAYDVNSMFIIHSPFDGAPFLRYPLIAAVALVAYFALFTAVDVLGHPKGERWFDRVSARR